jgi:hypothetical protein
MAMQATAGTPQHGAAPMVLPAVRAPGRLWLQEASTATDLRPPMVRGLAATKPAAHSLVDAIMLEQQ